MPIVVLNNFLAHLDSSFKEFLSCYLVLRVAFMSIGPHPGIVKDSLFINFSLGQSTESSPFLSFNS